MPQLHQRLKARSMLQIVPQMKILIAVAPIDFGFGIDRIAALCRDKLGQNPYGGAAFVFRNRRSTAVKILFKNSSLTVTGNRKLFNALFLKMSAKKLLTTTSNPKSLIAHAACSRLLPQPKFLPATKILPW